MFRVVAMLALLAAAATASSVLTHEAVIDLAWDASIKPILLKRFPSITPEQIKEAHAYAYGGAIIQDMGYYPFGTHFFSDLAHYIRSGDFIESLLAEATDVNELAFAIGSIAHYAGDHAVHSVAVNRSVALLYPNLRKKYGNSVTYENSPAAHLSVEFGFDVLQVAQGHYAPEAYHDFIGFKVSKDLLGRAFLRTYGLKLGDAFKSVDLAMGSFRFSVSTLVPEMTKAAWSARKKEIVQRWPGTTRKQFLYRHNRASFEKEWGQTYDRPGVFARILGSLFKLLPKVGPLRPFGFRLPTPQSEALFIDSLKQTMDRYAVVLTRVRNGEKAGVPNENFDTGSPVKWGGYGLADKTFERLLHHLAGKKYAAVDAPLRKSLLDFAAGAKTLPPEVTADLATLKALEIAP